MTLSCAPLFLANAFTDKFDGGNPAAIIFLQQIPNTEKLQSMAQTLNQPVTTFLYPLPPSGETDDSDATLKYGVRWFTVAHEIKLCGHGTLAAAGVIFSNPALAAPQVQQIHFVNPSGNQLTAKKVESGVEITLPSTDPRIPSTVEEERLKQVVRDALGQDVHVLAVRLGGKGFEHFMMAEIDKTDGLGDRTVNFAAFLGSGHSTNIITSDAAHPGVAFVSRMFAPASGVSEDHVCGSAHSLLTPYWAMKSGFGDARVEVKQVSRRGGDLRASWKEHENTVTLSGAVRVTAKGNIML